MIFPELEAPDEYERWAALTMIFLLHHRMAHAHATGTPALTPADVRALVDTYIAGARGYGIDRSGFRLVYLKGAIRRELAWQDDVKHYLEDRHHD